jgi:F-type H+-transporting ATPase subunit alpha
MAELTIDPATIRKALDDFVEAYTPSETPTQEVGHVATAGDGIAHVTGLPGCMANELLTFEDGTLNLDVREIGVVVLGDFEASRRVRTVRRTGEVLSVPVGDGFLGRVVDPLGNPIDGLGEIKSEGTAPWSCRPRTSCTASRCDEPLQTGIKAIDAMTPSAVASASSSSATARPARPPSPRHDHQPEGNWESGDPTKQVRCIYVAIGQKGSTIAAVRGALEEYGAMEYTTIVAAPASDPAGFKYIAPYTGSAIGQHWMYNGKHVLIVFDDLSKQAEAYRADVAAAAPPAGPRGLPRRRVLPALPPAGALRKLSDDLGGGSMTGLPIIETKANDVSAYIPTNVISITDGQIFLQSDLFNSNQRPAIDVGISVSRVGGAAQIKAMKKVAGTLKISTWRPVPRAGGVRHVRGSDLDAAPRRSPARPRRAPRPSCSSSRSTPPSPLSRMEKSIATRIKKQVVSVWAGTNAISRALLKAYMEPVDEGGVAELYIVYTEFINMVVQKVRVLRMLPVEVVKEDKSHLNVPDTTTAPQVRPLYSFEPSLDEVLDTVLPRYVRSRIHECLFEAAASEVACRQNAMHTATENARDLINDLTRKLNASRQASITQELTEIIGSADALNKKEE